MFKTLRDMFRIKDIRKKLFFTFLMLILIRFGSQLPVPGVNSSYFKNWFDQQNSGAFSFFSAFTGGSFERMSVFALNITPYITSSIIMELLSIAIPALEEMHRDGEDGRKKITTITRYLTVGLALFESTAMAIGFGRSGLIRNFNFFSALTVIVALTAGSAFVMWIGERITENGVGNGISIVLLINILSRIPQDLATLWTQFVAGKSLAKGLMAAIIIIAVILLTVVLTILLTAAVRRIPVQYAKKMQGRRMVAGQSSSIPLKVNTACVIPVIFASPLMSIPSIIMSFTGRPATGVWATIFGILNQNNWFNFSRPIYMIGLALYIALVIFFAYFYTSITFNPIEVADNLKKQGGFIPGIRPGRPTSDYLQKILNYIIFIGAVGLVIVVIIPIFFNGVFHADVSFGGTSLIIIVGVVLETIEQIESQMLVRNYKGFLSE